MVHSHPVIESTARVRFAGDVAAETCRTFYRIRERAIEGDRLPGRPIGIKYIRSARPGEKGRKEGERMNNACGEQLVVSNETDL